MGVTKIEKKKVPTLRFPEFTDAWEQRKLGELGEVTTGKAFNSTEFNDHGEYLVITNKDISDSSKSRNVMTDKINISDNEIIQRYNLSGENILVTMDGVNLGKTATYSNEKALLAQRVGRIKSKRLEFIYQITTNEIFLTTMRTLSVGNAIKHISLKQISSYSSLVPRDIIEQQKIGSFFKQLDDTITLQQRKLELLKEQKKGFLQKMFTKNGEKVPELRFRGFTDDWEQRTLGEIVNRVTRKNKELKSTLPLTISAQEGLIDQNEFFNKTVASRDVSGYYLVKNGEFAYNKSYSSGYPLGAVKRLNRYKMGVLSTLYIVFKPTNVDSDFLEKYYDTTYWHKEVSKHAAEGARNHGLLNIAAADFFKTELVIPKSIDEQQKIGSFFKQIDDTIALHQRKLDLLKEQKKAFLQQMFI